MTMRDLAFTGRSLAVCGAAAQLVGLVWDAVLHRLDPELAAREGIFTLSNPGHVLLGGGMALVVIGLGLMLAAPVGRDAGPLVRFGGTAALGVLSLGVMVTVVSGEGGLSGGHSHAVVETHIHENGISHTHAEHQTFLKEQAQTPPSAAHDHGVAVTAGGAPFGPFGDQAQSRHQHAPDVPISAADLTLLSGQVVAAREGTERYRDVRLALREGYVQVTQDLPLIAAHFANPRHIADGIFDPAKPEILLYAKQDGIWTLAGASYTQVYTGDESAPDGFAGPLDVWHYHTNLCFRAQTVVSAQMSATECRSAGGRFVENTGWMAHLWLYLESPEGLFAHQNSLLKGSGAVLTRAEIAAMQ